MTHWRELPVFGLSQPDKETYLLPELQSLTRFHRDGCPLYSAILEARAVHVRNQDAMDSIPFLPVRLFKTLELLSVNRKTIVKTVTSSGSTGQQVSRIHLDKETATNQIHALVRILQAFFGVQRLPILIVDSPNVLTDRNSFTARGAAIMGFQNMGRDPTYLLRDDDNSIDLDVLRSFLHRHDGTPKLVFGFTSMVWQHLVIELSKQGCEFDFFDSILIHGGGWKKLHAMSVDDSVFKEAIEKFTGIRRIHDYYGMAEQVGSIFVECEHGRLHVPIFADVVIRDAKDWSVLPIGELGVIQVLSILPLSYPGHSLLTEDLGLISGVDDCPCGRLGKTLKVRGRLTHAEQRGCSDSNSLWNAV